MRRWTSAQNAHVLARIQRFFADIRLAWHPPERISTYCYAPTPLEQGTQYHHSDNHPDLCGLFVHTEANVYF